MSSESSKQTQKAPALEFHGGVYTSLVPFLLFVLGSFGLAIFNVATVEGFWLVAIACIIIGMWLCKDPLKYFDEICRGTASPLLTTAVFCWLWSGAVAGILKASGLVNGLIWLGLNTGLTGGLFVGFTFLVSCIYSTATGTGSGTVAAMTVLLYPAGVALGADPWWMAAAIISGGGFGDNLAPISDTTITAATTMRVDVSGLVKNRMPYTLVAGFITLIIVTVGGALSTNAVNISETEYTSIVTQAHPKGLIMLLPAALIVFLALKGRTLIEALTYGGILAIVLSIVTGLMSPASLVSIDTVAGTVGGTITDAITGWYGMIILIFLVFAMAHLMQASGALTLLLEKLEKRFVKTKVGAEIACWVCIALSALGLCNNITSQIVAGPVMLEIADRYHLSHYRIANFSDAVQAMFSYTMPWGGPALTMCATSLIANSAYGWCPVLTSPAKLFFCGIYGIAIGLVFLVCAITGIGRKFDQRMDIKNLGYTEEYFNTME